jgi:hypothetical protein
VTGVQTCTLPISKNGRCPVIPKYIGNEIVELFL